MHFDLTQKHSTASSQCRHCGNNAQPTIRNYSEHTRPTKRESDDVAQRELCTELPAVPPQLPAAIRPLAMRPDIISGDSPRAGPKCTSPQFHSQLGLCSPRLQESSLTTDGATLLSRAKGDIELCFRGDLLLSLTQPLVHDALGIVDREVGLTFFFC